MAFSLFGKKKKDKSSGGPRYYDLEVKRVINETSDAITIVFKQPEEKIPYKSGQFLTLILSIDGKEVRRCYSLCSSPFVDEDLAVSIKRVDKGLVSNYLNDHCKEGDVIKVLEPLGTFITEFSPTNKRHLILFSGGSGITPMMSIIKSTLSQEVDSLVSLIYANRNIDSVIFHDELEKIQDHYEGRLHVIHILDDAPMNWQGYSGLLNQELLKKLFERIPNWGHDKTTYLMCGPEGMMKNVESLLKLENIPSKNVFKESFVQGIIDKGDEKASKKKDDKKQHEVLIHYDGEDYQVKVKPGNSILESALDQGVDLPYSCQSGLCTACRCKKIQGEMRMDEEEGLSEAEINDGYVLICVGHPLSDDLELEVG